MEHFIESIKQYPCLWDTTTAEYKDLEFREAAWTNVLKETGVSTVKEVKNKWKKLRDSYRDALKRKESSKDANKTPWKYQHQMSFLQPHMSNRSKKLMLDKNEDSMPATNTGDQMTSDDSDQESTYKRKRKETYEASMQKKLNELCRQQAKKYFEMQYDERKIGIDPLDIFFNSMCQATKRLPFTTQLKIKRVLFNAVTEAEEAFAIEQQNYATMWANDAASTSSRSTQDFDEPQDVKDLSFMLNSSSQ